MFFNILFCYFLLLFTFFVIGLFMACYAAKKNIKDFSDDCSDISDKELVDEYSDISEIVDN